MVGRAFLVYSLRWISRFNIAGSDLNEHWEKVIGSRLEKSNEFGLTQTFVRQLMDAIHQESIRHQTTIMNSDKK